MVNFGFKENIISQSGFFGFSIVLIPISLFVETLKFVASSGL